MKAIKFDPTALTGAQHTWFDEWSIRAEMATGELLEQVERGEKPTYKDAVWQDLKKWLTTEVFDGKCAYCEGPYLAHSYGAAEHYRPKGGVQELVDGKRLWLSTSAGSKHPGYYWLVYNWQNIVPACDRCNGTDAKGNLFDIDGTRLESHSTSASCDMATLDAVEHPLLLHPYEKDVEDHLLFGEHGVIASRDGSVRGTYTIRACRLDREELQEERRALQDRIDFAVLKAVQDALHGYASLKTTLDDVYARFVKGGAAAHSQFARQALDRVLLRITFDASWFEPDGHDAAG